MSIPAPLCCIAVVALLLPCAGAATVNVTSDLQAAIDAASPGDTLLVAPGVYDKIVVAKSIKLKSDGAVIRAGERDACISVKADNVYISGFLVRDGFYGILMNNVKGCRISNNTVVHCSQPGIALLFSDDNIVEYNNASFNGLGGEGWYGIYLSNSNRNLILKNTASNNGAYGIDMFPSCNNNTIRENILEKNMYGLYMFTDCSGNLIESNRMESNTNSGLDMRFNCHDNAILNNTLAENTVAGITLMDSGKNLIKGNAIFDNARYGLQMRGLSDNNAVVKNNISNSQTGVFLQSSGNQVFGNQLLENVVQAEDRGINFWNVEYPIGGNMWSDYLGEDKMKGPSQDIPGADGIGDLPYKISQAASDRYPLMGMQIRQIKILDKSIAPFRATVGESVAVSVKLESRYQISQVSVRAVGSQGVGAGGYVRMSPSGNYYQGSLATALMDPGRYKLVLKAGDVRGSQLEESLGEIEIAPRGDRAAYSR